jgi:hypothetical protein
MRMQPSVTHGYLPSGQMLEIVVAPVLYLEFQSLSTQLQVSAGGQTSSFPLDFKAPAGEQLMGLRTDPDERSVSRDWYCTNKPNTCSNMPGPDGSGPDTQVSGAADSVGAVLAMPAADGVNSSLASVAGGSASLQGTCSTCNTTQACKDVAALEQLIYEYNFGGKGALIGSFANFNSEFGTTLSDLANTDLACRYDAGSGLPPQVDTLLGDILRKKNSFKTVTQSATFPGETPCDKDMEPDIHTPECQDRQAISDINSDLQQLASALGCPQAAPPQPPGQGQGCPVGEEQPDSETKQALKPIIDGLKDALEKADEELRLNPSSEGIRERYEQYKKLIEFWEKIQAASCVPGQVLQALHEVAQKREGACNDLTEATYQWFLKMGLTQESAHDPFFALASEACSQAMSNMPSNP